MWEQKPPAPESWCPAPFHPGPPQTRRYIQGCLCEQSWHSKESLSGDSKNTGEWDIWPLLCKRLFYLPFLYRNCECRAVKTWPRPQQAQMGAKPLLSMWNKFGVLQGNREKTRHTEHQTGKWTSAGSAALMEASEVSVLSELSAGWKRAGAASK